MKRLLCMLAASLTLTAQAQTVPMDPAAFTEFGAQVMRAELGAEVPLKVKSPLSLEIDELQVNLDRIHEFCKRNAADCKRALADFSTRA